jgi:hypothetical protein
MCIKERSKGPTAFQVPRKRREAGFAILGTWNALASLERLWIPGTGKAITE